MARRQPADGRSEARGPARAVRRHQLQPRIRPVAGALDRQQQRQHGECGQRRTVRTMHLASGELTEVLYSAMFS